MSQRFRSAIRPQMSATWCAALLTVLSGCGDQAPSSKASAPPDASTTDPDASTTDEEDEGYWYAKHEPLSIAVTLGEEAWDDLRYQGRSATVLGCGGDVNYDWFSADVSIAGEAAPAGFVRKKGYLASLSSQRPSLRLKFGTERKEPFHGAKDVVLNNDRQDPSHVRQCLTYSLFARAGLAAPRCALAKVSVNGRDLGIYTHVEAIKKGLLQRVFGNDSGNLYEGQFADFRPGMDSLFEIDTNSNTADGSDLAKVTKALEASDGNLEAELERVVDVDQFLTFWAMEVLTGHWDSYSGNVNNFYVYHDPADDRFRFIVAGADNAFVKEGALAVPGQNTSVQVRGALSARLYAHPKFRTRYRERLQKLLDDVWDESRLENEAHRWADLANTSAVDLAPVLSFIAGRREALKRELQDDTELLSGLEFQCAAPVPTHGSVDVQWIDELVGIPPPAKLSELTVPFQGKPLKFPGDSALGWIQPDAVDPSAISINILGFREGSGEPVLVGFTLPAADYVDGDHAFHGFETAGGVADVILPMTRGPLHGVFADGTLSLERTSRGPGSLVHVSWKGAYVPWAQRPQ